MAVRSNYTMNTHPIIAQGVTFSLFPRPKDINDLKTLIQLTVNWIDNVLLTEQYLKSTTS
jgi:hypothetical protein